MNFQPAALCFSISLRTCSAVLAVGHHGEQHAVVARDARRRLGDGLADCIPERGHVVWSVVVELGRGDDLERLIVDAATDLGGVEAHEGHRRVARQILLQARKPFLERADGGFANSFHGAGLVEHEHDVGA
jgi:hypothetical protein